MQINWSWCECESSGVGVNVNKFAQTARSNDVGAASKNRIHRHMNMGSLHTPHMVLTRRCLVEFCMCFEPTNDRQEDAVDVHDISVTDRSRSHVSITVLHPGFPSSISSATIGNTT